MENASTKFISIGEYVYAVSDSSVPTKLVYKGNEYETLAISESHQSGIYRKKT